MKKPYSNSTLVKPTLILPSKEELSLMDVSFPRDNL